jgi:hypothetical protein
MRQHLVKLLFEEYKQHRLAYDIGKRRIDIRDIVVNNLDIILDIIGFPPDNLKEFKFMSSPGPAGTPKPIRHDYHEELFVRDDLTDRFFRLCQESFDDQNISVSE